jgi:DNA-binding NarL/FixJ family response regulator
MKIKVSIADDHPIVLSGLEKMLKEHPLLELCGAFRSGDALLQGLQLVQPDVLLLDIQMPGKQGDELARIISETYPQIALLVLTNMDQAFHVRNMFMHGARGYLLKNADQYVLVEAIETVNRGRQYIDASLREQMLYEMLDTKHTHTSIPTLTKREQEVLELIAEEMTSQQIAKELYISLSTVENHRLNLFFKLGVKNAVGLIRKAIQFGLIK